MKCSATQQSNVIYLNNCGSSRKKRVANLDEKHVTAFDGEADRAKIINEWLLHGVLELHLV